MLCLPKTYPGLSLLTSLVLFIIILLFLYFLKNPTATIHINANTSTISFRVSNPYRMEINLNNVNIDAYKHDGNLFDKGTVDKCVSGSLRLNKGNVVKYSRSFDKITTISISDLGDDNAPPSFISNEGNEYLLGPGSSLAVGGGDANCSPGKLHALPVWGPGEIGSEQVASDLSNSTTGFLFEGTAMVYARASGLFFSLFKKIPSALYLAGELPLPSGSRLVEEANNRSLTGQDWIGTARVPQDDTDGLLVSVSTNSENLRVYRAGIRGGGYETIEVSLFARLFKDPTIQWFQIIVGIFLVILELTGHFIDLLSGLFPRTAKEQLPLNEKSLRNSSRKEKKSKVGSFVG